MRIVEKFLKSGHVFIYIFLPSFSFLSPCLPLSLTHRHLNAVFIMITLVSLSPNQTISVQYHTHSVAAAVVMVLVRFWIGSCYNLVGLCFFCRTFLYIHNVSHVSFNVYAIVAIAKSMKCPRAIKSFCTTGWKLSK